MRGHLLICGAIGLGEAASLRYVEEELSAIRAMPVFNELLIRLDTSGGDLRETAAIVDALRHCGLRLAASLIEHRCDSLGLFLALQAERVYARPFASAVLHHLRTDDDSDPVSVKFAAAADLELLRVYARKTNNPVEELSRIFDMSARVEAFDLVQLGLVDALLPRGYPPDPSETWAA